MEMSGARVQSLFVLCCTLCSAELSAIEEWLVASFIQRFSVPPPPPHHLINLPRIFHTHHTSW